MKRILSVLLVITVLFGVGGCTPSFGSKIKVTALMKDSAGLFVGNDVGILGVPVGKVTAIKPDGDHVRVTMEINKGQAVPADAGAVVVARSVATDRYVELTPVYHSGPKMQSGAVIDTEKTRTPVDFDDVLAALNTFATGISGSKETKDAIKRILLSGSKAVSGKGEDFNRAITSLGGAVNTISGERQNIASTMRSLDALTTAIAQNQQLVRQFITSVSQASQLLADERQNFRSTLVSLGDAVTLVADFAHQNRQQLVKALDQAVSVMQTLMSRKDQLTETLQVMPVALQNLERILHGDRLEVRVDPTVILPGIATVVDTLCSNPQANTMCAAFGPSLLNLNNLLALLGLG
jgi:phospholipid/cholesterol/gamma-HCH transport system substrate-binding protein